MKSFNIPSYFASETIAQVKEVRRVADKLKKDYSPSVLDFGSVRIIIARHFGFCYGVENAVEIAYKAIAENAGKRIFLLSEMIHNPEVNNDLLAKGLQFIMDTKGKQLVSWQDLSPADVVIVPAFGTTLEIQAQLERLGINPYHYDTTCPFVEKVWKRASQIANQDFTVVVHGKPSHEETRATYSHSQANGHTLVIKDMKEAQYLANVINGEVNADAFYEYFEGRFSDGFDPILHLNRIGVVNQTTMLAEETQAISDFLKNTLINKYGLNKETLNQHFADTRDTLCYATNDNQTATKALLEIKADCSVIVGGYNSSNTQHLVELSEQNLPTYFINDQSNLKEGFVLEHYNMHTKALNTSSLQVNPSQTFSILLTAGASCPDSVMEGVLSKLVSRFGNTLPLPQVLETFAATYKS
jgi:4-hydroxy-3-methylbut-2-en-1-yl diphosphate reductase